MIKEYLFNTGVKPFSFSPPAAMAFMSGFRNSGNGVYVIPFKCEEVPKGYTFSFTSNESNSTYNKHCIVREIQSESRMLGKYAYFTKI